MIEVKNQADGFATLVIDDIEYDNRIFIGGKNNLLVVNDEPISKLRLQHISDFPVYYNIIFPYAGLRILQDVNDISVGAVIYKDKNGYMNIGLQLYFSPEEWRHLWSMGEYQVEFKNVFEKEKLPDVSWTPKDIGYNPSYVAFSDRVSLSFIVQDINATVEMEINKHSPILNHLHKLTEASLMAKLRQESVVMHFDFPEEVKVACEQYLVYFVQFLKDIGVEATAELQHEAGQVLFAVTPTNKDEALDKIRTALETYLCLAASPVNSLSNLKYEIAIQRLAGEIQGLQSRLSLARAEIQYKEATIQHQQATINQQRLLSDGVMVESMKNVTPQARSEDKEELIDGILAVGKYEKGGFQVNLGEIVRRLKQLFTEEE